MLVLSSSKLFSVYPNEIRAEYCFSLLLEAFLSSFKRFSSLFFEDCFTLFSINNFLTARTRLKGSGAHFASLTAFSTVIALPLMRHRSNLYNLKFSFFDIYLMVVVIFDYCVIRFRSYITCTIFYIGVAAGFHRCTAVGFHRCTAAGK